jgi:hypothetical protein
MDRPTLAEQVLQKMKEKRELEEKNRPPCEVLRMEVVFAKETNSTLRDDIAVL